jgi:hypothetical protein
MVLIALGRCVLVAVRCGVDDMVHIVREVGCKYFVYFASCACVRDRKCGGEMEVWLLCQSNTETTMRVLDSGIKTQL